MGAPFMDLWKLLLAMKKSGSGSGVSIKCIEPSEKIESTTVVVVTAEVNE